MFPDESLYLLKTYYLLIFYTEHHTGHMPAFSIRLKIAAHETGIFLFVSSDLRT